MDTINYEEFKKVNLRVAGILEAQRVEGSDKLVKLQVDLGDPSTGASTELSRKSSGQGKRQIVAGIGLAYNPEELIGRQIIIVENLEPRMLMGQESQGMLLAASENGLPILLQPDKKAPNGCEVK